MSMVERREGEVEAATGGRFARSSVTAAGSANVADDSPSIRRPRGKAAVGSGKPRQGRLSGGCSVFGFQCSEKQSAR